MDSSNHDELPSDLKSWKSIGPLDRKSGHPWFNPWRTLDSFLRSKGFIVFPPTGCSPGMANVPPVDLPTSPAVDSFGLYGDRVGYKSHFFSPTAMVVAARDKQNRDVVIKVVRKGDVGKSEYDILHYLNSDPLRTHPDNTTLPVLEFLSYQDFHFIVMPFCQRCDFKPLRNATEALDFMEQVLSALSFLHDHNIAHLDIAFENLLINYHGNVGDENAPKYDINFIGEDDGEDDYAYYIPDASPGPEFRSTFPVQYHLIDFGMSVHTPGRGPGSGLLVDPIVSGRIHKAPESVYRRFDPYAADVCQAGKFIYSWIYKIVPTIPGLLELFYDMTRYHPRRRPTMLQALTRLRALRSAIKDRDILYETCVMNSLYISNLPVRYWRLLIDAIWYCQFKIAVQLVFYHRGHFLREALTKVKEVLRIENFYLSV